MSETIKMPKGGFDIRVVRKEDILKCIDSNILDKDIMLAFINQLEVDATNFLSEGRWTSLPYIGTLRKSQFKEIMATPEIKQLNADAKETLDKNKYIVFRKNLNADISRRLKRDRVYRYMLSQMVKKNRQFYENLVADRGELIAGMICYTIFNVTTYNEYEY